MNQPIVLNRVLFTLALEDAVQEVAKRELAKQIAPYFPGRSVTVESLNVTSCFEWDGPWQVEGREVVWDA